MFGLNLQHLNEFYRYCMDIVLFSEWWVWYPRWSVMRPVCVTIRYEIWHPVRRTPSM